MSFAFMKGKTLTFPLGFATLQLLLDWVLSSILGDMFFYEKK